MPAARNLILAGAATRSLSSRRTRTAVSGINSGSVCFDLAQLEKQAAYIHNIYVQEALIEEYLDGREFNVSILGDRNA